MKPLAVVLGIVALSIVVPAHAQGGGSAAAALQGSAQIDGKHGRTAKTYVVLDDSGKEVKNFTAGDATSLTVDCAQIPCPERIGKDVVCWRCKDRSKAK